jgi:hypothetical protein
MCSSEKDTRQSCAETGEDAIRQWQTASSDAKAEWSTCAQVLMAEEVPKEGESESEGASKCVCVSLSLSLSRRDEMMRVSVVGNNERVVRLKRPSTQEECGCRRGRKLVGRDCQEPGKVGVGSVRR